MFNISSIRKQTMKGNVKRFKKIIQSIESGIKNQAKRGYNCYYFNGYYICNDKIEVENIANFFTSKGFTIDNHRDRDWSFDINW